ncbi:MAG: hypothetical protein PHU33_16045 [Bacteroidales bacterium]|nr:hypothetical protein [Bacteroidales bacterium]
MENQKIVRVLTKGKPGLALLKNKLSDMGYVVGIKRIKKRHYQVSENFEVAKTYKTRASCNRYLRKKFEQLIAE